jgi:hypothetical protein
LPLPKAKFEGGCNIPRAWQAGRLIPSRM